MKNGFTYSYTCINRMLEGLKKNSQSYWTEKIEVADITAEEYEKLNEVVFDEPSIDKVLRGALKRSAKVIHEGELVPKKATKTKAGTKKSDKPVEVPKLEPKKATKGIPQFSSLEDFFDGAEPAPKNKKSKKRV